MTAFAASSAWSRSTGALARPSVTSAPAPRPPPRPHPVTQPLLAPPCPFLPPTPPAQGAPGRLPKAGNLQWALPLAALTCGLRHMGLSQFAIRELLMLESELQIWHSTCPLVRGGAAAPAGGQERSCSGRSPPSHTAAV